MTRLAAFLATRLRLAILAALEVHEEPLPDVEAIREGMRQTLITEQIDATVETYDWAEDWADDVAYWAEQCS